MISSSRSEEVSSQQKPSGDEVTLADINEDDTRNRLFEDLDYDDENNDDVCSGIMFAFFWCGSLSMRSTPVCTSLHFLFRTGSYIIRIAS